MENIAGYVLDHTTRDEGRWRRLEEKERGPCLVSAVHSPRTDVFLKFVRLQGQKSPRCNPLDGREHRLDEIARWIGNRPLAIRFIGLGIILGVFELATPWEERPGEDREEMDRRLLGRGGMRFRLKGARPRLAIEGPAGEAWPQKSQRPRGPRRPRYTRCWRARAYGMTTPA